MVEYAAGMADIGMNDAEAVLETDKKQGETAKKNKSTQNTNRLL
jgi:hypothetical protein